MVLSISVTQSELLEVLLNVATVRPVFIWGAPGIGKSAIVEQFAEAVGLPCVSLLGSQLAPEDIIGIPQIKGETSEFLPPKMIARKDPYVLFLDELNACSQEVQKAFYSLIHERRVGEYHLPEGSIVIGAGNRAQDSAIVKTMSSALINRMVHVQLKADPKQWLSWAYSNGVHPWITEYITQRPDQLFSEPPKAEEPYSTPRSWHMLSDALKESGAGEKELPEEYLRRLEWSFRAKLLQELPQDKQKIGKDTKFFVHRAKAMIKELASINTELAQMVVASDDEEALPDWFMLEIVRDLPRLVTNGE